MQEIWSTIVRRYRVRHGLTQTCLAGTLGVSQRTVSRWERGQDKPGLLQQKKLRDMARDPEATLSARLLASVKLCPAPRALVRLPNMRLEALSRPAIDKRPSIMDWIGRDLIKIASGIQAEILEDRILQKSIARGEIACVLATTRSVLRTPEASQIGTYQTTITYFFHEGTLYSDAISAPAEADAACGYRAVPMDEALDC